MTSRKALAALALAGALFLPAAASAQAFRTYLSSHGVDNPACSLQAPCRLLPSALSAVAEGGEIWMLDSANYNTATVMILKSVTILAVPGALGSVVATDGNAIWATSPAMRVVLRNLVIVPLPGTGAIHGVLANAGVSLTVDNCLIANMPFHGIAMTGNSTLRVADSTIRDNAYYGISLQNGPRATVVRSRLSGNGQMGIYVDGGAGASTTTADIAETTVDANLHGVWAFSNDPAAAVSVSLRESSVVRNLSNGVAAVSQGGPVSLSASNNLIASNVSAVGIDAYGALSKVWASGNLVTGNHTGMQSTAGALFESAGNNAVRLNSSFNTNGPITSVARR